MARVIARLMARVGLVTPEQRAWAWYDWANSVYFTTVITAVFPSFYATYAAAGLEPAQATARFGLITTVSVLVVAIISPVLGALADYSGIKKKLLALFMSIGVLACASMVFITEGNIVLASTAVLPRQHRRVRLAGVLRLAAAARGEARGDRSRVGRRLRDGLCQRRRDVADQPRVDSAAGSVRLQQHACRRSARRSWPWPCGGRCSRCRCSGRCRSRTTDARADLGDAARVQAAGANAQRDPQVPSRVPDVHRDAALSGRHPDHHSHGRRLRRRSGHRPDVADCRVRDGAVRRHSVCVPVRLARQPHRHQARASSSRSASIRWPRSWRSS